MPKRDDKAETNTGPRSGFGVRVFDDPNVNVKVQDKLPDPGKEKPQ